MALYTADLTKMPIHYFRQAYILFGTSPALQRDILAGTNISPEMLEEMDALIPVSAQLQQTRNLVRLFGQSFTLDAKTVWRPASQGTIDIAFRSAETIGKGLEYLAQYAWIRAPLLSVSIKQNNKGMTLQVETTIDVPTSEWRPIAEIVMLSLQALLESVLETTNSKSIARDIIYEWPWPIPAYAQRMDDSFYGTNHYARNACKVFIPKAMADLKSPYADNNLLMVALTQLQSTQQPPATSQDLIDRIQSLLANYPAQHFQAPDMADALSLSLRTMNRKLKLTGLSFRELRDMDLKRRCQELILETNLDRDAIAQQLGYHDATSLSRSCRRWFGCSINKMRQEEKTEPHKRK